MNTLRHRLAGCLRRLFLPLAVLPAAVPAAETMQLATLEWPPYIAPGLELEGLAGAVVQAAARKMGVEARIAYFPWNRAMQVGSRDPQFAGYFPAYYTEERAAHQCHYSAPLSIGTLGLAYLRDKPLQWRSLDDLAGKSIGVVAGYSNGAQFDAMVQARRLAVDPSPNDLLNLRKLLARRVDAVAIDRLVLRYLLLTDPALRRQLDQVVFHERPLAELGLHVCFQRNERGRQLQQAFDAALRTLPLNRMESEYFRALDRKASLTVR